MGAERHLVGLALLVVGASISSGQSLNIDAGDDGGTPAPTFAGAGNAGVWNVFDVPSGVSTLGPFELDDLAGDPTNVSLTVSDLLFTFGEVTGIAPPDLYPSVDAYRLLHDQVHTGYPVPGVSPFGATFEFLGLRPGIYDVVTYTAPTAVTIVQSIVTINDDPTTQQLVDGSFAFFPAFEALEEGVTHVVHRGVEVDGSLRVSVSATMTSDQSYANGIQLVAVAACDADLNGDTTIDVFDVLEFLGRFEIGSPEADWNGDTVLDIFDVTSYLASFESCLR